LKDRLPVVAIMGRPNVGKSTLMNRLSATMAAIVDPNPGVTRDRKYVTARWRQREFMLADTGGVGIDEGGWLAKEVERQAFFAAEEADAVIMVVDVKTGVTADDEWLARKLNRLKCPAILVVNKVDNLELEAEASRFYELALGDPMPVSAIHGLGIGDLLDRMLEMLPLEDVRAPEPEIAIAIVGRPNVGKSSVLNQLAGEERALVHEEPHTTRDSIDTVVTCDGRIYRVLDTAGIRRKRVGISDIEYYSSVRTYRAVDEADVVLIVIDGAEGPSEHDQRIARKIDSRGRAAVILINKWDLVESTGGPVDVMEAIAHKFRFASHLPLLRISAITGRNMAKILPLVDEVFEQWNWRIPTPALNEFLTVIKQENPPPVKGGKQLKMYYATQAEVAPPTVIVFVNDAGLIKPEYRRFLVRKLREQYGFWGSPLRVHFRSKVVEKGG